jgi:hypothetical protein
MAFINMSVQQLNQKPAKKRNKSSCNFIRVSIKIKLKLPKQTNFLSPNNKRQYSHSVTTTNTKGIEMIETKKQIQIVDWKTAVKAAKDFSNVKEEPNILFSISEEIEAWDQNFLMKLTRR